MMRNMKLRPVVFSGILLMVIIFVFSFLDRGYNTSPFQGRYEDIKNEWQPYYEDEEIGFVYRKSSNKYDKPCICIYNTCIEYDVVVDGKVVYAYRDDKRALGNTYQIIELPMENSGNEVKIINRGIEGNLSKSILGSSSYYGEKGEIYNLLLRNNTYGLIILILCILCSGIVFSWKKSIDNDVTETEKKAVLFYAILFIAFGIWFMGNTQFIQIIWGFNIMLNIVRFASLFLVPTLWLGILSAVNVLEERFISSILGTYLAVEVVCFIAFCNGKVYFGTCQIVFCVLQALIIIACAIKIKIAARYYDNSPLIFMLVAEMVFTAGNILGILLQSNGYIAGYTICNIASIVIFMYLCGQVVHSITRNSISISSNLRISELSREVDPLTFTKNKYAFLKTYDNMLPFRGLTFICFEINCEDIYLDEEIVRLAELMESVYGQLGRIYRTSRNRMMVVTQGIAERQIAISIAKVMDECPGIFADRCQIYNAYTTYEKGSRSYESCSEMWNKAESELELIYGK